MAPPTTKLKKKKKGTISSVVFRFWKQCFAYLSVLFWLIYFWPEKLLVLSGARTEGFTTGPGCGASCSTT